MVRRFVIALVSAALAGGTWSCVTAKSARAPGTAFAPNAGEFASTRGADLRTDTCDTICAAANRCSTPDASVPKRITDACATGCGDLRGHPTPLEARVLDCASLQDCTGFQACTLAVFQPEQARSCAATCQAIADCRGRASGSCLRDCEGHKTEDSRAMLPQTRPCSLEDTCDALERCMVSWTNPSDARTLTAKPSHVNPVTSACHQLCRRSVECAGEAAQLAGAETARVVEMMDQGLVSCVLDCEANVDGEVVEAVRACASGPTCEMFGQCVRQF